MFLTDDGIRLNAYLDMPAAPVDKCPICVIIHGFTGHSEEAHITAVQEAMNEAGVATLRVDMYGHGKSEGEFRNHTLYKWASNAMTAIDYAKSLDFVTDIYLCGHSQGGLLSILVASMERDVIKALILLSPAIVIADGAKKGNLLGTPFDPDHIPAELKSWDGRGLDGNYVRVAQTIDVDECIRRYKGKTLIIHGTEDEAVPVSYSEDAAGKYSDCRAVFVEGDDHCYGRHLDVVTSEVKSFLEGLTV